ncbi:glycosyl transferase family 41-domain-containing protein [Baffinella frigidus]|nr:glycosyl transferase family 41-domain-containing protein [Cryptophyta sp. CCMP2293]
MVELDGLPLIDAARRVWGVAADVLVDMQGYTQHSRPELFAMFAPSGENASSRSLDAEPPAAPIRVSLLGFASSMQSNFTDAIATDAIASPPEYARDYTEALLYLPGTLYPTDHAQSFHTRHLLPPHALPAVTKTQVGLDPKAFTFASFNQPFKISAELFAVWMRILSRVPKSQLWIVALNEGASAETSLRAVAAEAGIAQTRLFFTGAAALDQHVGYKSAADLLLDTTGYNGHSTSADALFAGVPLVTLPGTRMAARVAASIAAGAGIHRAAVTRTLREYEEVAVRLALCPVCLRKVRRDLIDKRATAPLFDTPAWVSHWESALRMAVESRRSNQTSSRGAPRKWNIVVAERATRSAR